MPVLSHEHHWRLISWGATNLVGSTYIHKGPSTVWRYASANIKAGRPGSSKLVGPFAIYTIVLAYPLWDLA